jgi:hypothetical protein
MLRRLLTLWLHTYSPDFEFVKYPVDAEFRKVEVLSIVLEVLQGERPGYSWTKKPVGWIVEFRRCTGSQLPAAFQAFPMTGAPFFLMLSDRPSQMTPFQLFRLLHEIGHLTLPHIAVKEGKLASVAEYLCVLVMSLVLVGPHPLGMLALVSAFLLWSACFNHDPIVFEELADAYAVLHMVIHPDFRETVRDYKLELTDSGLLSPKDLQRRLLNIDRAAEDAGTEGDHPHTRFSLRAQALLPRWPVFIVLCLLITLVGLHASTVTWPNIFAMTMLTGIPAIIVTAIASRQIAKLENETENVIKTE